MGWFAAATLACGACADPKPAPAKTGAVRTDYPGLSAGDRAAQPPASRPAAPTGTERPAALLNGSVITWEDLRPMMTEASGGVVLQEAALDRILDREMLARKQAVSSDDIDAERKLLIDVIVREAKASPNDAERLLDRVRRTRGLGEVRFQHLLERNAQMRKMIAGQVSVSEAEVAQAFQMLHGEKYRIRVLVVQSQSEANRIRSEFGQGAPDLSSRFGAVAAKVSIDPSAARGGLMSDAISPVDPAYPASVRDAIRTLEVGQLSPVLAVDRGFAIVLLEEKVPADGATLAAAGPAIREEVVARRERLAMDDLARRLLQEAHLSALDRELDWSLKASASVPAP